MEITWPLVDYLVLCRVVRGDGGTVLLRCVEEDKLNAGKSKVMVLNGEERLDCEVYVDKILLEHVSEFKYFGWNRVQTGQNVVGSWRVPLGPR